MDHAFTSKDYVWHNMIDLGSQGIGSSVLKVNYTILLQHHPIHMTCPYLIKVYLAMIGKAILQTRIIDMVLTLCPCLGRQVVFDGACVQ